MKILEHKRMILIIVFTTILWLSLYNIFLYWWDLNNIFNPNITEQEILYFMEKYNLSCKDSSLFWWTNEENSDMPWYTIKNY